MGNTYHTHHASRPKPSETSLAPLKAEMPAKHLPFTRRETNAQLISYEWVLSARASARGAKYLLLPCSSYSCRNVTGDAFRRHSKACFNVQVYRTTRFLSALPTCESTEQLDSKAHFNERNLQSNSIQKHTSTNASTEQLDS